MYVAAIYREKAGTRPDRPELLRVTAYLQPRKLLAVEKIDRGTRLTLAGAEPVVETIREERAQLTAPDFVDLSELVVADSASVGRIMSAATRSPNRYTPTSSSPSPCSQA